jgi:hypothetical protein
LKKVWQNQPTFKPQPFEKSMAKPTNLLKKVQAKQVEPKPTFFTPLHN